MKLLPIENNDRFAVIIRNYVLNKGLDTTVHPTAARPTMPLPEQPAAQNNRKDRGEKRDGR